MSTRTPQLPSPRKPQTGPRPAPRTPASPAATLTTATPGGDGEDSRPRSSPTVETPRSPTRPSPRHSLLHPPTKPSRQPIVPGRPLLPSARDADPALRAVRTLARRWKTGSSEAWEQLLAQAAEQRPSTAQPPLTDADPADGERLLVNVPALVHAPEDLALTNAVVRYYNHPLDVDFGASSEWRGGSTIALAQVVTSTTRNANVTSVTGRLPRAAVETLNGALESTSRWRRKQLRQRQAKQREVELERIEDELKVEEGQRKKVFYDTWREKLRVQGQEKAQRIEIAAEEADALGDLRADGEASRQSALQRFEARIAAWLSRYSKLDGAMQAARDASTRDEAQLRHDLFAAERLEHFNLTQQMRERLRRSSQQQQLTKAAEYDARKVILVAKREEWRAIEARYEEAMRDYKAQKAKAKMAAADEERRRRDALIAEERRRHLEKQLREGCAETETERRRLLDAELAKAVEVLLRHDFESRNNAKTRLAARRAAERRQTKHIAENHTPPVIVLKGGDVGSGSNISAGCKCVYPQNSFGTPGLLLPSTTEFDFKLPFVPEVLTDDEATSKRQILGGRIVVRNRQAPDRQTETVCLLLPVYEDRPAASKRLTSPAPGDTPNASFESRSRSTNAASPNKGPISRATSTVSGGTLGGEDDGFAIGPPATPAEAKGRMSIGRDGTTVFLDDTVVARVQFSRPCDAEPLEVKADEGDAEATLRAASFEAHRSRRHSGVSQLPSFVTTGAFATEEPPPAPTPAESANSRPRSTSGSVSADAVNDDGSTPPPISDAPFIDPPPKGDEEAPFSSGPFPTIEVMPDTPPEDPIVQLVKLKVPDVLWCCELEPGVSALAVRALLLSLAYRNAYHTGYDVPADQHSVTLAVQAFIDYRQRGLSDDDLATRWAELPVEVTLSHPLVGSRRQPQHTFLEDAAPLRIFDELAIYSASGYRWASFERVDNDRAAAAGIDVGAFTLRVSVDILDRGDRLLLDDRDGAYTLTTARQEPVKGGGSERVAYILIGTHRVARVVGDLASWTRFKDDEERPAADEDHGPMQLMIAAPQPAWAQITMIDGPVTTPTAFINILLRLGFSNYTVDPVDGRRRIRLDLRDAKTGRAGSIERRVRVVPVDDITQMELRAGHVVYRNPTEVAPHLRSLLPPEEPVYVAPETVVSDPDSEEFIGGSIEIEVVRGHMPGDYLYCLPRAAGHPDALDVDVVDDDAVTRRPCTMLRHGRYFVKLVKGQVLTGVPAQYLQRTAKAKRRSSVAPLNTSYFGPDDSNSSRRPSDAGSVLSEKGLMEQVAAMNRRAKTPPLEEAERRVLIKFEIGVATCEFLQQVIRSVAFKATERQLGTRMVEVRLTAGDPFEVKFRKFDPFIPVTGRVTVAVCDPLVAASQRALVYREGMGLMGLPGLSVIDETSLGYRGWAGGWIEARVVQGYSCEEDRLGMRSFEQAVVDNAITLSEVVPDHVRDADFLTSIRAEHTPRDKPMASRRDRTEELQLAALTRHLGGLRATERSAFERHYEVINYERQVIGKLRGSYEAFRVDLRDEADVAGSMRKKKRNAPGVSTPLNRKLNSSHGSFHRSLGDEGAIRRKDIIGMLKQIVFENRSNNPEHVSKVLLVSVNDGCPTSTTHILLDLSIQLVDDVTEIVRVNQGIIDYRHGYEAAYLAPFGDCTLNDPDSNLFNTGYVNVALLPTGQCDGDALRFLSIEEQRARNVEFAHFAKYCRPYKRPTLEAFEEYEFIFDTQQQLAFVLLPDDSPSASCNVAHRVATGTAENLEDDGPAPLSTEKSITRVDSMHSGHSSAAAAPMMVLTDKWGRGLAPHLIGSIQSNQARKPGERSGCNLSVNFLPEGDLVPEITLPMVAAVLRCMVFHSTSKPTKCRSGNRSFVAKVNPGGGAEDGKAKVTALVAGSLIGFAELTTEAKPCVFRKKAGPCQPLSRFVVTSDILLKQGFICVEVEEGLAEGDTLRLDIGPSRPFVLKGQQKTMLYTAKELFCGTFTALEPASPGGPCPGFLLVFDSTSRTSGAIVQLLMRSLTFANAARQQVPGTRTLRLTMSDGTANQISLVRTLITVEVDDEELKVSLGRFAGQPVVCLAPQPPPCWSEPARPFADATVDVQREEGAGSTGPGQPASTDALRPPAALEVESSCREDVLTLRHPRLAVDEVSGNVFVDRRIVATLVPPVAEAAAEATPSAMAMVAEPTFAVIVENEGGHITSADAAPTSAAAKPRQLETAGEAEVRMRRLRRGNLGTHRVVLYLIPNCQLPDLSVLLQGVCVAMRIEAAPVQGAAASAPVAPPASGRNPPATPAGGRSTVRATLHTSAQALPLCRLQASVDAVCDGFATLNASAVSAHFEVFPNAVVKYAPRVVRLAWRSVTSPDEAVPPLSLTVNTRGSLARKGNDIFHDKEKIATMIAAFMPSGGVVAENTASAVPAALSSPRRLGSSSSTLPLSPQTSPSKATAPHRILTETDAEGNAYTHFVEYEIAKKGVTPAGAQRFIRSLAAMPIAVGVPYSVPHRFRVELEVADESVQVEEVEVAAFSRPKAAQKPPRRG
jgi:hypothetical protein